MHRNLGERILSGRKGNEVGWEGGMKEGELGCGEE